MKRLVVIGLFACSGGPTLDSFDPSEAEVGTQLTVFGSGFAPDSQVFLVDATGNEAPLSDVTHGGVALMSGTIPKSLKSGSYQVMVRVDGASAVASDSLAVHVPPPEVPCGGEYTANTQVSWAREMVVVDRFYKDGTRQVIRTPFADISGVSVKAVPHDKGTCSVVFILKSDGSSVRYAESLTEDLTARANKFANELKKPIQAER